jgi:hypothetical protein
MGLGYLKRLRGGIVAAYVVYQGEVLDAKRYDEYKTRPITADRCFRNAHRTRARKVTS